MVRPDAGCGRDSALGADVKLTLVAAGRLKAGPERALIDTYRQRLKTRPAGLGPLDEIEIDDRKLTSPRETLREFEAKIPTGARRIALDERGAALTSREFADLLGGWRDAGAGEAALLIGPADGLSGELRQGADKVVSFGALTWPHMLARVLAAEQLYRAAMLLAGHPYHRD